MCSREDARPADPAGGGRQPGWTRTTTGALIAILIGVAAFQIATIRPGHDWGDDFAMYIGHARNLAEGRPYAETGYIYNRNLPEVGPRSYPPVFPLLLTPVVRVFGLDLEAMKVEIVLFFVGSLALLAGLVRNEWPPIWTLALLAVIGFNPFFWAFKDQILSDVPFLFFVLLTLALVQRAYAPGARPSIHGGLLLGLGVFLATGTRTVGLVLVPVLAVMDVLRFRRPSRTLLTALVLFAGLAAVQSLLIHVDTSYRDQLHITGDVIRHNVRTYPGDLASIWGTRFSRHIGQAVFLAAGVLAAIGWGVRIRRGRERVTVLEVFAALYLVPVVLWPTYQGTRFLIPWVPVYLFFVLAGARVVGERLGTSGPAVALAAGLLVTAVVYGKTYAHADYGPIPVGVERPASREVFAFVRANTSPTDVLLVKRPRAFVLYTRRPASVYHETSPPNLWRYIARIHAKYLVVGPEDGPTLRAFVASGGGRLHEMFRNTDFTMYEVTR